jgi:hypothetical protein
MSHIRLIALLILAALAAALAQGDRSGQQGGQASQQIVNPLPQSPSIRILTPVSGQMLASDFVVVRFEAVQPVLSDEPDFQIQLDDRDPVNTSSTDYTFTGLQPGVHTVRVTLVDANFTPAAGGAATVQFKVPVAGSSHQNALPLGARPHANQSIAGAFPPAPIPPELRKDGDVKAPIAGSPLPVLSLIGFGLLIGGAIQTMRRRSRHSRQLKSHYAA